MDSVVRAFAGRLELVKTAEHETGQLLQKHSGAMEPLPQGSGSCSRRRSSVGRPATRRPAQSEGRRARRITDVSLGKMPTTSEPRLISRLTRSSGFVLLSFGQCASGNAQNARRFPRRPRVARLSYRERLAGGPIAALHAPKRCPPGKSLAPSEPSASLLFVVFAGFWAMPEEGLEPPTRGL
jgi:hypothetical protein